MYLESILKKRGVMPVWDGKIPWEKRQQEIIDLLMNEEYGILDIKDYKVTYEVAETNPIFCAKKATLKKVIAKVTLPQGNFEFPFITIIPNKPLRKYPFFIHINFRDKVPGHFPYEEIVDNGFAILSFVYGDVTSDNDDFTNGLAGLLYKDGKRKEHDAGKIRIWAWAASRILDYAYTIDNLDTRYATVTGHSRLGKTALVTGALDKRFFCSVSNCSGCSGAAISREKSGEKIREIYMAASQWFCKNYGKYADKENKLPFDQHFLIASIAPRCVCVGSAELDVWADPYSEYLSCVAASDVYEKLGVKGLSHPDGFVEPGTSLDEGKIGYSLRHGEHYFSRENWQNYMNFIKSKMK